MEYMTIQEAAALWSLSERRVQVLCSSGRIEGAAMFGRQWAIPANASKPVDARVNYRKKKVTNEIQCGVIHMASRHQNIGISPDAVLEQIDYSAIKDLIPDGCYDFVDFFCGCGGMSYGFHKMAELTGRFRWAGAVDIDKHAIKGLKL